MTTRVDTPTDPPTGKECRHLRIFLKVNPVVKRAGGTTHHSSSRGPVDAAWLGNGAAYGADSETSVSLASSSSSSRKHLRGKSRSKGLRWSVCGTCARAPFSEKELLAQFIVSCGSHVLNMITSPADTRPS